MNDPSDTYEDIINLPHHVSRIHPHMTLEERAAQFSHLPHSLAMKLPLIRHEDEHSRSWKRTPLPEGPITEQA